MTYYDRLNEFYRKNAEKPLPPTSQLLMLHILQLNNELGNPGVIECSDGKLREITQLSKQSITDGKRRLKNGGYLDFKVSKERKVTIYQLPGEIKPQNICSPEVQDVWLKCEGETLRGGVALGLVDLEKLYGTKKLIEAIIVASQANTRDRLSFNFVRAVLRNMVKSPDKGNDYGEDDDLV